MEIIMRWIKQLEYAPVYGDKKIKTKFAFLPKRKIKGNSVVTIWLEFYDAEYTYNNHGVWVKTGWAESYYHHD